MNIFKYVYRSDNGYTGVLNPHHRFSIYDSNGREVLHTASPAFRSYDELVKRVDNFPHIRDLLFDHTEDKDD